MDSQEWQFWLKKKLWTELESRYLLTGIKPIYANKDPQLPNNFYCTEAQRENFKNNVELIVQAIDYQNIKAIQSTGDRVVDSFKPNSMDVLKVTRSFKKEDVIYWAIMDEGIEVSLEIFEWFENWQAYRTDNHPFENAINKKLTHTSELLEIQNEVIAEFWETYEPDTPPTKDDIITWLGKEYPNLSGREKTAIDMITRPNKYKKGHKGR